MTIDWIQAGLLGMAAAANLIVVAKIVNKNGQTMGEFTTAAKNLTDSVKELHNTRFDHEHRITQIETACDINHTRSGVEDRRKTRQS